MTNFEVHFFCDECSQTHFLGMVIARNAPAVKTSVGDAYSGLPVPATLQIENNSTRCTITGRLTSQKDNNQVFLVPVQVR